MKSLECTAFLQWSLPQLRLRWEGFRKVRGQVCKRLQHRIDVLGLSDFSAYKNYLTDHIEEWEILDVLCYITISRFYRDRQVFDALRSRVIPFLAQTIPEHGGQELRFWSAGCCSGEEPYTLQIIWQIGMRAQDRLSLPLRIIATDINQNLLERAKQGCYSASSLRELPEALIQQAFSLLDEDYCLQKSFSKNIEFIRQDIRIQSPPGMFHLILCRNLVCTYFEKALQTEILKRILDKLLPGGFLIIGSHESLPNELPNLAPDDNNQGIYQKL
jgi:chemotaxis protein methyltransferase CheR